MANDYKITHITGNVGSDPTTFDAGDTKVLKLSVGVTLRYGEEKETRWVNCSLWADTQADLIAFIKEEISKGSAVAVEGYLKTDREYKGVKQFDMRVVRIGLVTWAKRDNSGQPRSKPAPTEVAEESGLDW